MEGVSGGKKKGRSKNEGKEDSLRVEEGEECQRGSGRKASQKGRKREKERKSRKKKRISVGKAFQKGRKRKTEGKEGCLRMEGGEECQEGENKADLR
ncbi:hypothetical protein E2C01_083143 [Portunus trituberculatus]|uniref:Uncharacterized protein n=1 Tax=Portunus trituberculatus TaxID=210409 RepID=A0A5B7J154_PORTR|nr:hypothetical protein [Portunus trituberculatus]